MFRSHPRLPFSMPTRTRFQTRSVRVSRVSQLCAKVLSWSCIAAIFAIRGVTKSYATDAVEFFESNVRPVLIEHCQKCHGEKKQEGGLRLDSQAALVAGGESGPAIVPGKPDESLIINAIRRAGDLKMPPAAKLSDGEIAALTNWVSLGADWPPSMAATPLNDQQSRRTHWAFQPIANPVPPAVHDEKAVGTDVDRFVLAKLGEIGLTPTSPADRRTLIRRVTYDLTGLPPTEDDVRAFERDSATDAYPELIGRLLASPQYGEQWARHWLDVARYSDSKGYVYAREERFWVHAAAYRDWVVLAFNQDLPYDQFLKLQIAADQVAPADLKARAAMGFLTVGRRFLGVTHDIIDDRIDVVMRGTMGLTVACARCHDHKYDPIPTADYYSLYGIFLNSTERMESIGEPSIRTEDYFEFEKELELRKRNYTEFMLLKKSEASERVRQRVTDYLVAQTELSKYPVEGFDQILSTTDLIPNFVRRWERWLALDARVSDSIFGPWHRFSQLKPDEFAATAAIVVRELAENGDAVNPRVRAALTDVPKSMREVAERYGQLFIDVDREWTSACEAAKATNSPEPTELASTESESLRQCLYGPGSPCWIPNELLASTENYFDSATIDELWKLQNAVDQWLIQSPLAPVHMLSLVDREFQRPSQIFRRGNPTNRGATVPRHFVSVLAGPNPPEFTEGSGRRALAEAIVAPTNPLTARVWVNRVWQHHFGTGLVRTPSDFGVRAESPSHPELLDWLASRFVYDGWSTKRLHRLILLSNTYQQRSEPQTTNGDGTDTSLREMTNRLDPENRLLSRMNVRRLSFEEFRDSLLLLSGRLDFQMGGKASDLFASDGTLHRRRTVYGLIDRQFLPSALRIFDFANPDLHTPLRSETTVPQQALFAMNHPFVAQQAQALVARVNSDQSAIQTEKIRRMYRIVYQRDPTPRQLDAALSFLETDEELPCSALDCSGPMTIRLNRWEQFAQVLLIANELMFID